MAVISEVALLLVSLALAGDPVEVTNLALPSGELLATSGNFVAFLVDEAKHGGTDLNGDGDAVDRVVFVHDAGAGVTTNLGLAHGLTVVLPGGRGFGIDAGVVAFPVGEHGQGGVDLNGDGDANDLVLHVHDVTAGATTNVGLATMPFAPIVAKGRVAFEVRESAQAATDLNGDGDTNDAVLHLHEVATGATVGTGLASAPAFLSSHLVFDGDHAALPVPEGPADLNDDGDTDDDVLFVYEVATGASTNVGVSIDSTGPPQLVDDLVLLVVGEADEGATDRNGDGDALDRVASLYRISTATTTNLALAAGVAQLEGERVAFVVPESSQGGVDRNGDGDALDKVLAVHDAGTGATTDLGVASLFFLLAGDVLAYDVWEAAQGGVDANGDGDADDLIVHTRHLVTGEVTNLGVSTFGIAGTERLLSLRAFESASGAVDLNGDGDADDIVTRVHDLTTGLTTNLGLQGPDAALDDGRLAVFAAEDGVDRNGDGDGEDDVLVVHDLATGTTSSTGLAARLAARLSGDVLAFLVSEAQQGGVDRNGDGDALDDVLHVADLDPAACGAIAAFGDGCPGPTGAVPTLDLVGCPREGGVVDVLITRGRGGAAAFVLVGWSAAATPLGAGCTLNVEPILAPLIGPLPLAGAGAGHGALSLPAQVARGALPGTFTVQAFVAEPDSALGFVTSNGVAITIP